MQDETRKRFFATILKEHNHHFKRPKDEHGNLSCLLCVLESKAHKKGMEDATEIEDCLKIEKEERHNEFLNDLEHIFNEIKRTDKTPKYEYDEEVIRDADNNGDFPKKGKRWLMPREIADKGLELIKK